ncbi:hypothetical protein QBZ16_000014 [Prototheca wickerhamii]|uniref:Thioredoxin domain-containing protein n=1 Tax=Prototheca wickerhamii TaxID=3111 RepID=A0AAD9MP25_PROWI|nr:hypothetical protein QBZ16_000014 [Prototheca wickerhamii]
MRSADVARPTARAQARPCAGATFAASAREASSADEVPGDSAPVENVVIVGSGPAGYTAAIYAARANLRPLMYEGYQAGGSPGGQLMTTSEVENFPGFPQGVAGPELMDLMRRQAARWGTRFLTEDVEGIDFGPRAGEGSSAAPPRGISACAICDGASPLFRGREVVVVGGGDTALEEALYLLKYATRVHLLVRGGAMRASMAMQRRVLRAPRVSVRFHAAVEDVEGDGSALTGVRVRDASTGKVELLPARGLFYGIGHEPNSQLLRGAVALDAGGYVVPAGPGGATNVPGVYVAGDLQDKEWRQAITAAGRWLAASDLLTVPEIPEDGADGGVEETTNDGAASSAHAEPGRGRQAKGYAARDEKQFEFDPRAFALRKLYHDSPRLLAVLYTAPTCAPCRTIKPILRALVNEYKGKMHLVEIDIEDDPEIAQSAGVTSTPTLQFFKNKKRILHLPGVKMKREYRSLIESNLD